MCVCVCVCSMSVSNYYITGIILSHTGVMATFGMEAHGEGGNSKEKS